MNTTPPGASIRLVAVNGGKDIKLGVSPVKQAVTDQGEYTLIAEKPGYTKYEKRISLDEEEKYDIELTPVLTLLIRSDPPGADITLEDRRTGDSRVLGKSPLRHTTEGGVPYIVKGNMEGYQPTEVLLDATPGEKKISVIVILSR